MREIIARRLWNIPQTVEWWNLFGHADVKIMVIAFLRAFAPCAPLRLICSQNRARCCVNGYVVAFKFLKPVNLDFILMQKFSKTLF